MRSSASGLLPSPGGEQLEQVLARGLEQLLHGVSRLVLDRLGAAVREQLLERPGQPAALGVEYLVELRAELLGGRARLLAELGLHGLRHLLELGLDELGVGRRLLAVEHPRADLDRVRDDLVRIRSLLHQAHQAVVDDHEAVDLDAVACTETCGL